MSDTNKLITDNLNLVYSLVSKEYPTYIHDEDIIQSGMVGLCKAANNFDETKSKFSTYAWKCIRNEINREFINRRPHSKTVSLSTQIGEDGTLEDILVGDDNVAFIDKKSFMEELTPDEQYVMSMDNLGFSVEEISSSRGWGVQKVQKLLRIIRIKWKKFNE